MFAFKFLSLCFVAFTVCTDASPTGRNQLTKKEEIEAKLFEEIATTWLKQGQPMETPDATNSPKNRGQGGSKKTKRHLPFGYHHYHHRWSHHRYPSYQQDSPTIYTPPAKPFVLTTTPSYDEPTRRGEYLLEMAYDRFYQEKYINNPDNGAGGDKKAVKKGRSSSSAGRRNRKRHVLIQVGLPGHHHSFHFQTRLENLTSTATHYHHQHQHISLPKKIVQHSLIHHTPVTLPVTPDRPTAFSVLKGPVHGLFLTTQRTKMDAEYSVQEITERSSFVEQSRQISEDLQETNSTIATTTTSAIHFPTTEIENATTKVTPKRPIILMDYTTAGYQEMVNEIHELVRAGVGKDDDDFNSTQTIEGNIGQPLELSHTEISHVERKNESTEEKTIVEESRQNVSQDSSGVESTLSPLDSVTVGISESSEPIKTEISEITESTVTVEKVQEEGIMGRDSFVDTATISPVTDLEISEKLTNITTESSFTDGSETTEDLKSAAPSFEGRDNFDTEELNSGQTELAESNTTPAPVPRTTISGVLEKFGIDSTTENQQGISQALTELPVTEPSKTDHESISNSEVTESLANRDSLDNYEDKLLEQTYQQQDLTTDESITTSLPEPVTARSFDDIFETKINMETTEITTETPGITSGITELGTEAAVPQEGLFRDLLDDETQLVKSDTTEVSLIGLLGPTNNNATVSAADTTDLPDSTKSSNDSGRLLPLALTHIPLQDAKGKDTTAENLTTTVLGSASIETGTTELIETETETQVDAVVTENVSEFQMADESRLSETVFKAKRVKPERDDVESDFIEAFPLPENQGRDLFGDGDEIESSTETVHTTEETAQDHQESANYKNTTERGISEKHTKDESMEVDDSFIAREAANKGLQTSTFRENGNVDPMVLESYVPVVKKIVSSQSSQMVESEKLAAESQKNSEVDLENIIVVAEPEPLPLSGTERVESETGVIRENTADYTETTPTIEQEQATRNQSENDDRGGRLMPPWFLSNQNYQNLETTTKSTKKERPPTEQPMEKTAEMELMVVDSSNAEEERKVDALMPIVPVIVNDLRRGAVSKEEREVLEEVFGARWTEIMTMAKKTSELDLAMEEEGQSRQKIRTHRGNTSSDTAAAGRQARDLRDYSDRLNEYLHEDDYYEEDEQDDGVPDIAELKDVAEAHINWRHRTLPRASR